MAGMNKFQTRIALLLTGLGMLFSALVHGQQDAAKGGMQKVAYYLDASCENCFINHSRYTRVWVSTEKIMIEGIENQSELISKFREVLVQELKEDSALLRL